MEILISVERNDPLNAMRGFLRQLFERQLVEALYVPLEAPGGAILPSLVVDPAKLELANPLAPVMPINGARAVAALTGKRAPGRLGAVLRPCEIRALVELAKLQQASLENLLLISLDCPGTLELSAWRQSQQNGGVRLTHLLAPGEAGNGLSLRQACRTCAQPVPEGVQVHLRLFGADLEQGIPVALEDELAAQLEMAGDPAAVRSGALTGWQAACEAELTQRRQAREQELASMRAKLNTDGGFAAQFRDCIRCHNCMVACPICYCKTCLFRSPAFDHPPEHYLQAARQKGALRLLGDTTLFHLTRLHHMSLSCVSCGMCTSACPSGIPVGTIFSTVAAALQEAFHYVPGRDLQEPLPLVTFEADEWQAVGEPR